ncbi:MULTISPECIES: ANTAR domain-containing protein [Pseudonocardia]|uniref:ANTAR domain protein n=2 Tax=Pseudonocardia TaxID=1847 RepID=A0A1Y2N883_PSEAH|nr:MULTISPECIES: ANTAR domain-containing protein [Pseudonocardia]OSY43685.1 ANTAR domain protein [Pseudonocardia autotrophica]TDN73325.1 ANTAR domain-containing protein [Pseudonocardia autotrophica]BBG04063.1 transcriptional regulator [Pseudonocardia autotrophica]GEC26200.1 transcriptional regulator [Pseudonocardia saturnea]
MQSGDVEQITAALRANADQLTSTKVGADELEERFAQITASLVATVPGAKWACLTIAGPGGLECHAPTDDRLRAIADLMVTLGHGPWIDAISVGTTEEIVVGDLARAHERWPQFGPRVAAEYGMASVLCHAMAPADRPTGAISVWSDEIDAFADPVSRTIMDAFAAQAAVAVYGAQQAAHLTNALASRDVIGRAKGILMERFGLTDATAFALLVRSSQDGNVKLHDIAEWLSTEVATRGPGAGDLPAIWTR